MRGLLKPQLDPVVVYHRVQIASGKLGGMRIVLISDTHATRTITSPDFLATVAAQAVSLGPDLILHGGDFITRDIPWWRAASIEDAVTPFAALKAPLGAYAVLGNHDWRDGGAPPCDDQPNLVTTALMKAGITVLSNAGCLLSFDGTDFYLCGTDSYQGEGAPWSPRRRDDVKAALSGAPEMVPRLLLAHEPDVIVEAAGQVDLQMSGHCHRGQLDVYGWRPLAPSRLPSRHTYGLSHYNGTPLIVSAGIGFSGLPLRIAAPPEITVIDIDPSKDR